MDPTPSSEDLVQIQRIHRSRRRLVFGAFGLVFGIALVGLLDSLAGLGHGKPIYVVALVALIIFIVTQKRVWRCARCQSSLGRRLVVDRCPACGVALEPRPDTAG